MHRFVAVLRSVAALVVGYLLIALGTTLTLEVWLGGVSFESPLATQLLATLGTGLSGLVGGMAAGLVAGRRELLHGALVSIPLALDTTYVVTSGISSNPVWYDLGGGVTLMLTAAAGGLVLEQWRARRRAAVAA